MRIVLVRAQQRTARINYSIYRIYCSHLTLFFAASSHENLKYHHRLNDVCAVVFQLLNNKMSERCVKHVKSVEQTCCDVSRTVNYIHFFSRKQISSRGTTEEHS